MPTGLSLIALASLQKLQEKTQPLPESLQTCAVASTPKIAKFDFTGNSAAGAGKASRSSVRPADTMLRSVWTETRAREESIQAGPYVVLFQTIEASYDFSNFGNEVFPIARKREIKDMRYLSLRH
jgi:hypothetical protein